MISFDFDIEQLDPSFDMMADSISKASSARVSYFALDGTVVGDSHLTFEQVIKAENHSDRPELMAARSRGIGTSMRYSTTLRKDMIYIARFNADNGYFARVALPADTYRAAIVNIRWNFTIIVFITLITTLIFGVIALRIVKAAVKKERKLQEKKTISKTREITLLQTMTSMVSSASCLEEAKHIFKSFLNKLFPTHSGCIFILQQSDNGEDTLVQLLHWGRDDVTFVGHQRWLASATKQSLDIDTDINQQAQQMDNLLSLKLINDEQQPLGLLQLHAQNGHFSQSARTLAFQIAEQIGIAITNIRIREQLTDQAIRDPLTELYNRRFMMEAFGQALNRAERHHSSLATLMVDLDHFKQFNDTFGHDAGDIVLKAVAHVFQTQLRLEDIACRYGGEEFFIICPDTHLKDAFSLAEKLRKSIGELALNHEGRSLGTITISTGIAVYPNHAQNTEQLISESDKALYQAKKQGRNCTVVVTNAQIQKSKQQ